MKNCFRLIEIMIVCFCLFFISCGTREDLINSYNSCFVSITKEKEPSVVSEENQTNLIREDLYELNIYSGISFFLTCPCECDSYKWEITTTNNNEKIFDSTNIPFESDKKSFFCRFNADTSDFFYNEVRKSANKEKFYRLCVEVTDNQKKYSDSALLRIYIEEEG